MLKKIKNFIKLLKNIYLLTEELLIVKDLFVESNRMISTADESNPLNKTQLSFFSQADEDGITIEILKRLNITHGNFIELGVGDGLENNTLVLLSQGWKGVWMGNEDLAFKQNQDWENFYYNQLWITKENIIQEINNSLGKINIDMKRLDVVSLDLGGNDYVFIKEILKKSKPKLFIVEYNPKFPPGSEFYIKYDPNHIWNGDDYYGSSLHSLNEIFRDNGYTLVSCNSHTGANAFFVQSDFVNDKFSDIPREIIKLYRKPRYVLPSRLTHKRSGKTIYRLIELGNKVG